MADAECFEIGKAAAAGGGSSSSSCSHISHYAAKAEKSSFESCFLLFSFVFFFPSEA